MFSRHTRLLPFLILALIVVVSWKPVLGWLRSLPRVQEIHPKLERAVQEASNKQQAAIVLDDNDWPCWRGSDHTGVSAGMAPILPFCVPEDVIWQVPLTGRGHASPIVCGDSVFLLNCEETVETTLLLAYSTTDGALNWSCPLHQGGLERLHIDNTHASSTPLCDGTAVYCVCLNQAELSVSKVDLEGKLLWQTAAGPYTSYHGYGVSPLLYENMIIVGGDNHGRGFISAIDRNSGELVWRTARQNLRSQGTPTIGSFHGQDQVLYAGQGSVTSYNPFTGMKLWQATAAADETANTPTCADGLLFATGGYPQRCVQAIRLDGSGQIAWEQNVNDYVPSLLVSGERLLAVQDNGVARLFDIHSGDDKGSRRLGGDVSASPVGVGDQAIVINEAGHVFFLKMSDRLNLIGQTDLGSPTFASPAIAQGRVFIRTVDNLLCIDASNEMKMSLYRQQFLTPEETTIHEVAGLSAAGTGTLR